MWSKQEVATHQRALAVAKKWAPEVERLKEYAAHSPAFAERIAQLATMVEYLQHAAETAITLDPEGTGR